MDAQADATVHRRVRASFRPDIAALRALAVTAVVLFHYGVPGVPGGFVGVDVFFVISGFLMTSILTDAAQRGRLSILGFYAGRVRRIVPAMLVVTLSTLASGYALLLPDVYRQLAWDAIWSDTFTINAAFARTRDYFAPSVDQSWFLHCWSLAVEIQFYLVIPFVVLGSLRFARRRGVQGGLLAVAALSLIASYGQTRLDPASAFYVPSTRAWEFAAGGLVSTLRLPSARRGALAAAGLALILAAVVLYDSTMAYPGLWPLVPVLGTALVIWAQVENRAISAAAVQYLGDISYSVYLWHWPVLLACRILLPGGVVALAAETVATLGLSALTYRYVETPFRSRGAAARIWPAASIAAGAFGVAAASWSVIALAGLPGRVPADIRRMVSIIPPEADWRSRRCFLGLDQSFPALSPSCLAKTDDNRPRLAMWGDSTVAALYPGIVEQPWSRQYAVEQITASQCSYSGFPDTFARPMCPSVQSGALALLSRQKPDVLLLTASGSPFSITDRHAFNELSEGMESSLSRIVSTMRARGVGRVVVVGPPPQWPEDVKSIFAREALRVGKPGRLALARFDETVAWDRKLRADVESVGGTYVSLIASLCDDGTCVATVPGETKPTLMQFDQVHLTPQGSAYVAAHIIGPSLGYTTGPADATAFNPVVSPDRSAEAFFIESLHQVRSQMPQHYAVSLSDNASIHLAFHADATQAPNATLLQQYDTDVRGFSVEMTSPTQAALFLKLETGGPYVASFELTPDADHDLVLTVRDGRVRIYLDGSTVADNQSGRAVMGEGDLWIGGSGLFAGRDFDGSVTRVAVTGARNDP